MIESNTMHGEPADAFDATEVKPEPILRPEARVVRADRSLAAMVLVICTLGGMGVGFGFAMYLMRAQLAYSPFSEARFYATPQTTPLLGVWYLPDAPVRGALITKIQRGTSAELAGMTPGDLITTIDGRQITPQNLQSAIRSHDPGDILTISLERGGRPLTLHARLGFK